MLRLAQAASSEYYSAYGSPPNQRRTGATKDNPGGNMDGELNVVPFYGGWQYVFRAKDAEKAEKIAWLMEGAVENGAYIGYGQDCLASDHGRYPRTGLFDAMFAQMVPDPRKLRVPVNCDCSSSAGACVYSAGVQDMRLRDMWTGTEREILMSTGEFVELTDPLLLELGTGLRRGDILLKTGHTAIAIDTDDHTDTFPVRIEGCAYTRIRTGPGTEYETLYIIPSGTVLEAFGTSYDDDGYPWYRVRYDGRIGYTGSAYAKPLPAGSCVGDTWLRKDAGTKGEQIIVIPKGATVYLTGNTCWAWSGAVKRTWYECIYGGHQGWASGLYVHQ